MIVVINELFLFLTIVKAFAFELMAFIQKLLKIMQKKLLKQLIQGVIKVKKLSDYFSREN